MLKAKETRLESCMTKKKLLTRHLWCAKSRQMKTISDLNYIAF